MLVYHGRYTLSDVLDMTWRDREFFLTRISQEIKREADLWE